MTVALEQPKVITWAGNYWPLTKMPDDEIKWLEGQFDQDDPFNQRYLAPIRAELMRRLPSPEKLPIIEAIKANSFLLAERFKEELAQDGLLICDLVTVNRRGEPTSNRMGEGYDLALSGRWEFPDAPGRAFLVDSYKNHGSRKYSVKSINSSLHNFNLCGCDDHTYKAAGKLKGFCKHCICVWMLVEALKL